MNASTVARYEWNPYTMHGDPIVLTEVNRLLVRAGEVIDSVDRSRLGSFALNREAVVAEYAMEFSVAYGLNVERSSYSEHLIIGNDGWNEEQIDDAISRIGSNLWLELALDASNTESDLAAEVHLWQCVINNIDFDDINHDVFRSYYAVDRFAQLRSVYENPSHVPFYEAGIWDDDFIARCVKDSIDVELANRLKLTG